MALANFFDRAATAASQVLQGFDLTAFRARLENNPIEIVVDQSVRSPEGAYSLDLLVRLLARLYPFLTMTTTGDACPSDVEPYRALARSINPAIDEHHASLTPTVKLVIGRTAVQMDNADLFYLGSEGWTAYLSTSNPVGSGATDLPFGAGAAACLAAANCFRAVFRDQLVRGHRDDELTLSLIDYGRTRSHTIDVAGINIGESHLVGAGAIGNGALWALARTAGTTGVLHVIDHEAVDLGNLQRYVLPIQTDVNRLKTDIARDHLRSSSIQIVPHQMKWHSFLEQQEEWMFQRVAVALDNAPDRLAVQAALPRWIVNAWTQDQDLGVSRHRFGETACLACLYLPQGKRKDQDELMAEEIGMPGAVLEVRRMLQTGEPVEQEFIDRVATALNVAKEPLLPFVGQPLSGFYQVAICGGLVMRLSNGANAVRTVVPLVFQSALAGIMLAAELLKHCALMPPPIAIANRINLLRPVGTHLADPRARDATGRCLCRDEDFLSRYREKFAM